MDVDAASVGVRWRTRSSAAILFDFVVALQSSKHWWIYRVIAMIAVLGSIRRLVSELSRDLRTAMALNAEEVGSIGVS